MMNTQLLNSGDLPICSIGINFPLILAAPSKHRFSYDFGAVVCSCHVKAAQAESSLKE
jgi:hypothetical protein